VVRDIVALAALLFGGVWVAAYFLPGIRDAVAPFRMIVNVGAAVAVSVYLILVLTRRE
jgi:hypothetical protein